MRVLHVTPYFAPAFSYGGPPRSILGLCKALLKVGVNVEVYTTTANGNFELPASPGSGDVFEGVRVRYFQRGFPKRFFSAAGLSKTIPSVLDDYDLLHIHGLWNLPAWAASQVARRARLPYVISPRGMLESGSMSHKPWRKRLAYLMVERRNLVNASFLHATSADEGQTLKNYSFDSEVVVLANGVDFREGNPLPRGSFRGRYGLDKDDKLIVFLGRIHPIKRLDILAGAFCQVREAVPNAHLVIAGPDERGYQKTLEPMFARVGESTHWAGEVGQSDKWALLRDADVLVMCSDSESFGMSVAEAMAAGVPVVVTKTCPWREIEATGCGFWVAQEAREVAKAVIHILSHPIMGRAMGERAKALAERNYRWDSIARKMADHYASAIVARSRAV